MATFRSLAALLVIGGGMSAQPVSAQSSGMGIDLPANLDPQQMQASPDRSFATVDAARDCRRAQAVLESSTAEFQKSGASVDAARAQFDYLRTGHCPAWLFALESVDSLYADPNLMRRSLANGRWLDLCEDRLRGPPATDP